MLYLDNKLEEQAVLCINTLLSPPVLQCVFAVQWRISSHFSLF